MNPRVVAVKLITLGTLMPVSLNFDALAYSNSAPSEWTTASDY